MNSLILQIVAVELSLQGPSTPQYVVVSWCRSVICQACLWHRFNRTLFYFQLTDRVTIWGIAWLFCLFSAYSWCVLLLPAYSCCSCQHNCRTLLNIHLWFYWSTITCQFRFKKKKAQFRFYRDVITIQMAEHSLRRSKSKPHKNNHTGDCCSWYHSSVFRCKRHLNAGALVSNSMHLLH